MAGKMIAIANMKGGVGKTTTVVSLAEALAADNPKASILVIDLDPQASASVCLAGDDLLADMIMKDKTIDALLDERFLKREKTTLKSKIHKAVSSTWHAGNQLKIALLPCGPDLRIVEREIVYALTEKHFSMKAVENEMQKLFDTDFLPLVHDFDYVICDCPPGISTLSEAAIRTADLVIVPTIPDFISVFGLKAFNRIFWKKQEGRQTPKQLPHVLVTRWQKNVKQHKVYVEHLERADRLKAPEIRLFETKVQQAAALAEALGKGDEESPLREQYPIFGKKYGDLTDVLAKLVQEVKKALQNGH